MLKNVMPLLLLCSGYVYASDSAAAQCLQEQLNRWDWAEKGCPNITPDSFNETGKVILSLAINAWVNAAESGNIPTDRGLAQFFFAMKEEGPEKLIHDEAALRKTNEYDAEYSKSPSIEIEKALKTMHSNQGNYNFPGAPEVIDDRLRITRQHEFHNMMYKRHEAPKLPAENLVFTYCDKTSASAIPVLKLNIDNTSLKSDAIRGITLLGVYYLQEDMKQKKQ